MEKQALYIDPRTKLFLLLVMNIVMLDTSSGVLLPYLSPNGSHVRWR